MKDFDKIKSYQERLRKRKAVLDKERGKQEALLDSLRRDHKCKSLSEAKELAEEKRQKEKALSKKIRIAVERFEKKYEHLLERD